MTLLDIVLKLAEFKSGATICADQPFQPSSGACVIDEEADSISELNKISKKTYFLEIEIAREVLEGWCREHPTKTNPEELCIVLIHYAINDCPPFDVP